MLKPLLMLLACASAAPSAAGDPHPAALVGEYDGHQMEMAVGIALKADGRFEYGLSYGALDEQAAGTWTADDGHVLLTSDPVTPPRFAFLGQQKSAPDQLRIALDLPAGMSRQYFDLRLLFADGSARDVQLGEDETQVPFVAANPPAKALLALQIFQLASDPVTIDPAKGYQLAFRFEPNDLGKVDFRATPLERSGDDLLLERYGRSIRFRRVGKR